MPAGLRDTLREFINPQLRGIEMGPSYNPIAPKRLQYNVTTVDHAPADVLRQKYGNANVDINLIEDVDIVWTGGDLLSVFPDHARETYHYIVAAHFIEHMTDMVSFIKSCEALLMTNGLILLLVPDQRYCFDFFQPTSDAAELIERHLRRSAGHGFAAYYRHLTQSVVADNNRYDWDQGPIRRYATALDDPRDAIEVAQQSAASADYVDTHGQYFTPCAFQSVIEELRYLGLITVSVHYMSKAVGCEFLAVLRKHEAPQLDLEQFRRRKLALQLGMLNEKAEQIYRLQASDTWQDGLHELAALHYEGTLFIAVPAMLAPLGTALQPQTPTEESYRSQLSGRRIDALDLDTVCEIEQTYRHQELNKRIADRDEFCISGQEEYYWHVGRSALRTILNCLALSRLKRVNRILDLPCGHGRVARHLRAAFPEASLTFCDLNRDGVDFCASAFNGTGVYSLSELPDLQFSEDFDLIWVGSLFTHVDLSRTERWLKFLCSCLAADGILVASFHGPWTIKVQEAYSNLISETSWATILDQFKQLGYGFAPYPDAEDYGISLSHPSAIAAIASKINGTRIICYTERGWVDNHDIIAIARTDREELW